MKTDRSTEDMRLTEKSHILEKVAAERGDHDGRNEGKIKPFVIFTIIMVSFSF